MVDLSKLAAIVEYADNHRVKNVKFKLPIGYVIKCKTLSYVHSFLNSLAKDVGANYENALVKKSVPDYLAGVVLSTKKRKCLVLVYFA